MTKLKITLLGALLAAPFFIQANPFRCELTPCGGSGACSIGGQMILCTLVCSRGQIIECDDNPIFSPPDHQLTLP